LKTPQGKEVDHGAIIKPIATNICGSDQHIVRGRTTAPRGLVLGHEITGEVTECGRDVEFISKGDLVSVPFNIACGRCRTCKERHTDVGLNVNPSRANSSQITPRCFTCAGFGKNLLARSRANYCVPVVPTKNSI
jgi:glutathione-independent formaldehyde dehydrogenase